jgi:2',3'-cyclic-nucleotide 2'-phosphodiesterase (5'-nucleotidase family)
MKLRNYSTYIIAILLVACNPTYTLHSYNNKVIGVEAKVDSTILTIISPYQNGIEDQMNEVLTYAKHDLTKGRPQSTIGNFVTDLCLFYSDADICVMNNGGLRTTISKGEITRGKLYELMPFENELVVLKLNKDEYISLLNYIGNRGGEPFSGTTITINKDGQVLSNAWPVNFEDGKLVRVLTSDYLANGGDKMWFFKGKEQIKVGIKLRDAIIDYCSNRDSISSQIDSRLIIIEDE